jgi:hypothetical protein
MLHEDSFVPDILQQLHDQLCHGDSEEKLSSTPKGQRQSKVVTHNAQLLEPAQA